MLVQVLEEFFRESPQSTLFAGAGVSVRAGLPDWRKYLAELGAAVAAYDQFTKFQMDEAISEGALEAAASYFQICRKIPESTRFTELVAPLRDYDASKITDLAKLPFSSIVTTNFDRSLFDAYSMARATAAREVNIDDPTMVGAIFLTEFYIARLHGRVEVPGSIRLSTSDFITLATNNPYQQFIAHLLTRRQLLFVGFSFLDPAIKAALSAVTAKFGNFHGNEHLALIPSGDTTNLGGELAKHSIRVVEYDPRQGHQELWEAIRTVTSTSASRPVASRESDARDLPFRVAKKYLATAYARIRVGGQTGPLGKAVVEGVVSGLLRASSSGMTESEVIQALLKELAIEEEAATTLVNQSLFALARDKIIYVVSTSAEPKYISSESGIGSYERAIERLVDGAVNRHLIREKGADSPRLRTFLQEVFVTLVLRRGWDLGAAFASRRVPEDIDVFDILVTSNASYGFARDQLATIAGSIEDLLSRPDDTEVVLLAELGRLGFGLELLIESPHDALFIQRTIPERIYLDANVLMPAITPGHPHSELFNQTITALQESASRAVTNVSICVCDVFLNEIVSHRQLAIATMRERDGEGALWAEREVGLLGSAGVNVFIGAYFNIRAQRKDLRFDDFLREYAPYVTEAQLRKHLQARGFEIVRGATAARKDSSRLLHMLERFYATKLEHRTKSAIVVGHDATQLSILNSDLSTGRRAILVSADRSLRAALQQSDFVYLANGIISHLGLAQLVELLVGTVGAPRGLSSLLWMSEVSSETERVRNYLINLALQEHDAALTMTITDVVDAIAEDAAEELRSKELTIDPDRRDQRESVNRVLERYESDFFKKMREAMRRG